MQIPQGKLEGKRVGRIYARGKEIVKELRKNSCKEKSLPVIVDFCEFEGKEYMGCMAGINYITINNDGLVTPCVAVPLSFGNINNSSLEDIYIDMQKYFPDSDCVCYGIASGIVMRKDSTIVPLNLTKKYSN